MPSRLSVIHPATSNTPEQPVSFLDRLRFTPEPPWSRGAGLLQILFLCAAVFGAGALALIIGFFIHLAFIDPGLLAEIVKDLTAQPQSTAGMDKIANSLLVTKLTEVFAFGSFLVSALLISAIWRGRGVVKDWGLRFKWIDLLIGAGLAILVTLIGTFVIVWIGPLLGTQHASEVSNVDFGSAPDATSLWIQLALVVVLIPISEEVAFRGVVQRALSRFGGPLVGILLSALLFCSLHVGGSTFAGQLTLLLWAFVLGIVLAIAAAYYQRLGPGIVAHMLVNLYGSSNALLALT